MKLLCFLFCFIRISKIWNKRVFWILVLNFQLLQEWGNSFETLLLKHSYYVVVHKKLSFHYRHLLYCASTTSKWVWTWSAMLNWKNNSWCYSNLLTMLIAYVYLKYFEQSLIVFKKYIYLSDLLIYLWWVVNCFKMEQYVERKLLWS